VVRKKTEKDFWQKIFKKFSFQVVRKHGGVIVHVMIAFYMFTGLALVCDDYFVPALDRISEGKKII
jgi:hypothetical protein